MADHSDTNADKDSPPSASLLAQSTKGATYLILLQIGSRALTFFVNQILLRFLSPELLGISTQLELYIVTVLFFARESLRVALQRQEHEVATAPVQADGKPRKNVPPPNIQDRTAQEVVNISYIAIGLGLPLAFVFASLYIRTANTAVLQTPFISRSLNIYTLATILELFSEPCFALAQLQMLYGVRALAETLATLARCLLTCGTAVWASKTQVNLGVLPFAIGQIGYAFVLNVVYLKQIAPFSARSTFSIFVRPIVPSSPSLIFDRFLRSRLSLAFNIYAQSLFKHLLTTGDALLIAAFTSLQTQGAYALAANYGGLVARMVFQPIEESSRSFFGRLLHHPASESSDDVDSDSNPQRGQHVDQAAMYIRVLLRFYSIASVIVAAIGPTLAPLVLPLVAGSRWSDSDAPSVLAAYCYYIPLLAINGILEAFVSAAASPEELRVQSAWMIAFSAAFAGTGFLVLKVWNHGAHGLVLANAVNMTCRIVWSWKFLDGYLRKRGSGISYMDVLPDVRLATCGIGASWYFNRAGMILDGGRWDLIQLFATAGSFGLLVFHNTSVAPQRPRKICASQIEKVFIVTRVKF
ncbi:MAG: hypothetical protein Q9179_005950 [Wetmoreana sp. 5 TL-2023]